MVGFQHLRVVGSPTFAVNLCVCYNGDIYIYIIHMVISAFGVFVNTFLLPDDIPWVSTSRRE